MVPRKVLERQRVRRAEDGERREADGEQQADEEQHDAPRGGLFASYLVGDGGEGAQHEARKQRHDGEGEQVEKRPHAEEAQNEPHDAAEDDGQKEARALLEAAEDAAEGVEEFLIQAEDDGDGRAAHPGHDDGKPDERAQNASLENFLFILIAKVHAALIRMALALFLFHAAPDPLKGVFGYYTIAVSQSQPFDIGGR